MEVKNYFATDTQGNVLGSAQVYLYLAGTTTLATGLQNISGAALGNPFTSEANGLVQFKAPDNNYDLRVVKPGREFTIRIQCFDGVAFIADGADKLQWDGKSLSYTLAGAKSMSGYSELRSYSGSANTVHITDPLTGGFFTLSSDMSPADNGGTRLVDSLGRAWDRAVGDECLYSWFRTVDSGGNDTTGLKNAMSYAFSKNKKLVVDSDVYTYPITISSGRGSIVCRSSTIYVHPSFVVTDIFDNMLLDFGVGVTGSTFDLRMDLGGKGMSGAFVRGPLNTISVDAKNSRSQDSQTRGTRSLLVSGDYCNVPMVISTDFISADSQGDGASAVTVAGYAKQTQIGRIVARGGGGALLNNGQGTTVDSVFCDGCLDNVVYDIEGSRDLYIKSIRAINCYDEVLVFNKSRNGRVDSVVATNCGRGVGLTSSVDASIGEIVWVVDIDSPVNSGSPLFTRPNQQSQSNSLRVGRLVVRGKWSSGAPIFSFQNLGIKNVSIGEIDADITYASTTATKSLSFFDSSLSQINIGSLSVVVRDGTGTMTSSDIFTLNIIPTTPLGAYSSIGGFHISNGGGLLSIRVPRINDPNLVINDMVRIRSDIGTPFATNEDDQNRVRIFYGGTVPTTGAWKRGDIVMKVTPGAGAYAGWECVADGTPGTWKQFGMAEA